jgi:crotonobetainyl-CoA:carnitine CoA-transferase CaiB-like acyl-CoA transferase
MEMPELQADPRFANPTERLKQENRPAFMALFHGWLHRNTRYEAMAKAQARRVPLTAVNPPSALLQDPHFQARGAFAEIEHPLAGTLPHTREPFRMLGSPAVPIRRAPLLGEHTATVLQQHLGLSPTEITDLRQHGVI